MNNVLGSLGQLKLWEIWNVSPKHRGAWVVFLWRQATQGAQGEKNARNPYPRVTPTCVPQATMTYDSPLFPLVFLAFPLRFPWVEEVEPDSQHGWKIKPKTTNNLWRIKIWSPPNYSSTLQSAHYPKRLTRMICRRKTSTPANTVCIPHALDQGRLLLKKTAEKRKSTSFWYD